MAEPIYRVVDNGLGELLAVGANGLILHSVDNGATWVGRNSGSSEHLYGAAYGDVLGTTGWIVVGANGTVLKSTNGSTWFALGKFTLDDLYDVAFGGVFIAVGVGGIMATSENFGSVWQLNESGTLEDLHSIEIDSASYIIVGANDTVITGTVLSLEFNVEIIEGLGITGAATGTRSSDVTIDEGIDANDSVGGRTAGQKVQFTTTGTVEAGDTYTVVIDGVSYDLVTTTEVTQSDVVDGLVALINEPVGASGSNVITNSDFTTTDDWLLGAGWNISGGTLNGTAGFGNAAIQADMEPNTDYLVTFTISGYSSGSTNVYLTGGESGPGYNADGTYTIVLNSGTALDSFQFTGGQLVASIDNVTVELLENKAFAANEGGLLTVTSYNPPTPYTYSSSVIDVGTVDIGITELKLLESMVQQTSADLAGVQIGDDLTITLVSPDGGTEVFNYVAIAADDTATATALAAVIDASPNYEASSVAGVITIVAAFPDAQFTSEETVVGTGTITLDLLVANLVDGLQFYEYLTEGVYADEVYTEPTGVYNVEVTEIADTLEASPSTGSFQMEIVDGAVVSDIPPVYEWSNGIGGTILMPAITASGELWISQLFNGAISLPLIQAAGDIAAELGGTLVVPFLQIDGSIAAEVKLEGTIQLPFLDVAGQLILSAGEDNYVVWIINAKNKAHSNYTNFKANSLVSFNGETLIANDTGIYALEGEDDDGVAIESAIRWVPTDYGTGTLKRLDAAYVNIRHATDGKLVTVADENEQRNYDCILEGHQTGMHKKRVLFVRGLAGEHWEIGFENRDGKFTLKDIEVTPVASKRRIK